MPNQLTIRSYSRQRRGHFHNFYQLVLPLKGVINLEIGAFTGKVAPGECVVIKPNETHHFTADPQARFVVADLHTLPPTLADTSQIVFSISAPLNSYLTFIERQLEHQVNPALEQSVFDTFFLLLAEQQQLPRVDNRIQAVLQFIEAQLADKITLSQLANIACLSDTQFKKLFREQVGQTPMNYVTAHRMEKARALLQHTDYPIQVIANQVGYDDVSAFSRRFSSHYGLSPSRFNH